MPNVELLKIKHWYKRWWAIGLLIVIIAFLFFGSLYLYQIINIYRQMKAGTYVSMSNLNAKPPHDMSLFVDKMIPAYGADNATVSVVEFGDFNCKYTLKEYPIFRSLMERYKSRVKFYWRNSPMVEQSSVDLAVAAVCAYKQGKFWPLHDKFFQMFGKMDTSNLNPLAQSIGLNVNAFQSCLKNDLTMAQVRKDASVAEDGGVKGTPTFFVNGYKVQGAVDEATWVRIIESFLKVAK